MAEPDPGDVLFVFFLLALAAFVILALVAAASGPPKKEGENVDGQPPTEPTPDNSKNQETVAPLTREPFPSATTTFPEIGQPLVSDDIRQLLAEQAASLQDRRRTLAERWNNIDVRDEQLARKIKSGEMANTLFKQKAEFLTSVSDLSEKAADFRRRRLESHLAELELEDKILERRALRGVRLETQQAIEEHKHRKLLEPEPTPTSARERVIEEAREDRHARVRAGDRMLKDFLNEVHLVCESRASIHERALRLRNLLDVFEMGEESLPADARWILRTSEKIRDAS